MSNYEVKAELVLDDKKIRQSLDRINKSLRALMQNLDMANKKFAKLGALQNKVMDPRAVGGAMGRAGAGGAMGSAGAGNYLKAGLAIGAMAGMGRVIWDQVTAASAFRKEMEMAQFTVATLDNIVNKTPMDEALGNASEQMFRFNKLAAQAPGGPKDLIVIYQRLFGIMSKGGKTVSQIEEATKNTAIAGKLFGIQDVGSLGRDVEEMLSGRAGIKATKLFSLGKSTGMIQEDSKQWNAMSETDRLEKTMKFLDLFSRHGEKLARTWEGASESFGGWLTLFRDVLATPAFDILADSLFDLNMMMERNLTYLRGYLELGGKSIGNAAGGVVGGAMGAAGMADKSPVVTAEAVMYGGMIGGGYALIAMLASLSGIFGTTTGVLKTAASIMSLGFLPVLGILAGVLAIVVSAFEVLTANGGALAAVYGGIIVGVLADAFHILGAAFRIVVESLKVILTVLMNIFAPLLGLLYIVVKALIGVFIVFFEVIRTVYEAIYAMVNNIMSIFGTDTAYMMETLGESVAKAMADVYWAITSWIIKMAEDIGMFMDKLQMSDAAKGMSSFALEMAMAQAAGMRRLNKQRFGESDVAEDKTTGKGGMASYPAAAEVNIQRMIINQEFKGKADPDRVVAAFRRSLTDQALMPISSPGGFRGTAV